MRDAGGGLELVEANVLRLGGRHEAYGHGHQPEADRSRPDGLRHGGLPRSRRPHQLGLLPSQVVAPPSKRPVARVPVETPRPHVEVDGRRLRLTNLDKVLYPATGFTKGQVIDFYARIGPTMLPHLDDRPVTMVRLPDGDRRRAVLREALPRSPAAVARHGAARRRLRDRGLLARQRARAGVDRQPRRARAAHAPGPRRRSVAAVGDRVRPRSRARTPTSATARASRSSCTTSSTSSGCARSRRRRARRVCTCRWGSGRRSTPRPRRASRSHSARCSSRATRSASR